MLKLQNICKTYKTKAKAETQALKNVNLELSSRGMVFVLGKSGSGKSTLLNLLGGLDSPTSGEIFVDGKSMASFTPSDYADYRNDYVGFIFQEFNLLADFNVKDNVSLALKLRKTENTDGKVSEALKQVELTDDYLTRRIDEMSGGEKQRIAIARALIKQSKMILADEPTGNLDSQTGESIWNILKSLSTERLVVVVSHDRESAEKYADRIIEIADGEIISDTGSQPSEVADTQPIEAEQPASAANEVPQPPKKKRKNRLSFATCLKMGFNNLKLRKVKTISVILVAVLSILSIVFTEMALTFSPEASLAAYMQQNDVEYFSVTQGDSSGAGFLSIRKTATSDTKQFIAENCRYIDNGFIKSKQDILDMGLTFVGEALELDDNSYYVNSFVLETYYKENSTVKIDGKNVKLDKTKHPVEYLVGKKVGLNGVVANSVLVGVIDVSGHVDEFDGTSWYDYPFPQYFYKKNFAGLDGKIYSQFNNDDKRISLRFGVGQYSGDMAISNQASFLLNSDSIIVTANGVWSDEKKVKLADNEIVLPFEIYKELFGVGSKSDYVDSELNVRSVPKEIGQTFKMKLCKYGTTEIFGEYDVKLAGVHFEDDDQYSKSRIVAGYGVARQISLDTAPTVLLIQTSSVENLSQFVTALRRDHNCGIEYAGIIATTGRAAHGYFIEMARVAYMFEDTMHRISFILLILGAILVVVLVLLVINLVSFSITNRKREIGILSAIGASNKDISGIFLLETGIIAVLIFVLGFAASFVIAYATNALFSQSEMLTIVFSFMRVNIWTIATLVLASFGLLLLAALIPLRRVIKQKPVDAIRHI